MASLLALDVATVTGWAFGPLHADGPTLSGHIRFGGDGAVDDDVFFKAMCWLTDQINVLDPTIVAIEAPINSANPAGGSNAATLGRLIGLQSVLRTVVRATRPSLAKLVHVQSARKTFIGSGNLPGAQAKKLVQARCVALGWLTVEDMQADRADACCVWAHQAVLQAPELASVFRVHKSPPKRRPASADIGF